MSDDRWTERPKKATKPWRPRWQSSRAPGTPQSLEALFEMMNRGNTGTGAFRFARAHFGYLTDEDLWSCYESWLDGKLNPIVVEKRDAWEKRRPL